jgi:hypothetical protein
MAMLWKNVHASFNVMLGKSSKFNVVPLHSFAKGLKYILASDQTPKMCTPMIKLSECWNCSRLERSQSIWMFPIQAK